MTGKRIGQIHRITWWAGTNHTSARISCNAATRRKPILRL